MNKTEMLLELPKLGAEERHGNFPDCCATWKNATCWQAAIFPPPIRKCSIARWKTIV